MSDRQRPNRAGDGVTVRRNPRVVFHRLNGDESAVLLHLDTSAYHSVNVVGALIWELIDAPLVFDELHRRVAKGIADAPPELRSDLIEFLDDLAARGLVELDESARAGA